MRKALGMLALVAASTTLGSAACSSDGKGDDGSVLPSRTGQADAGSDSAAPLDCSKRSGKVSDDPACDTCAKAKCCDEISKCDESADCAALEKCLDACADNDTVCVLSCQATHDKGASILQDVGACAQNECAKECPIQMPDGGGDAPF